MQKKIYFQSFAHLNPGMMVALLILLCLITVRSVSAEQSCILKMGWEPYKPFQFINKSDQLTGLDIELVKSIVKNMGCELRLQKIPWKRLLEDVKDGTLDIAASSDFVEKRTEWAYFSQAYRKITQAMFVLREPVEKNPITSLKDIIGSNFDIGVNRGSYIGKEFAELMKNPSFRKHVQEVKTVDQNIEKLLLGRIDSFIYDAVSGVSLLHTLQVQDKIKIHPIPIHSADLYLLLSKESVTPELVEQINLSITEVKKQGLYDRIMKKYLE